MPLKRYEILLPLRYNDGSKVEPEKFEATQAELLARFGALSFEPYPVKGLWSESGRVYKDKPICLVVDVDDSPETLGFFREYKETLKVRFKQIEIWITAHPIDII